jgi:hypothetical protein
MKEIKKPDIKGPRYRPEVHNIMNKEFFDSFRQKHPKYKNLNDADLRNIGKAFNRLVFQTVIDTRDGVQLPESIGWLFVGTCQQSKKYNIDFAKSHQYGVTVSNKNWATDGKLAKIFYTNHAPKIRIKNREFWKFIACREFKRAVAKGYPENWQMYIVADPTKKIEHTYSNTRYKEFKARQTAKTLETYNEFDL